jgi:cell division protein FtsL
MKRKKNKGKSLAMSLAVAVVIVLILLFYIWHQVESIRLGYDINRLESRLEALQEEIATLEAERAELLSPENVETIAREELGFTEIRDSQIVASDSPGRGNRRP